MRSRTGRILFLFVLKRIWGLCRIYKSLSDLGTISLLSTNSNRIPAYLETFNLWMKSLAASPEFFGQVMQMPLYFGYKDIWPLPTVWS